METVRVGVVILVPEPLASRVREVRSAAGDQGASVIPTHVTLVPPTQVAAAELDLVIEHVREVSSRSAAFELILQGTETFAPITDVAYLRVHKGAQQCALLQEALRTDPLVRELDYPYHPHVTLAQNVGEHARERAREAIGVVDAPIDVASISLFAQPQGQPWAPLEVFTLGGVQPA